MDNQQVSSEKEKLQRLSLLRGVHYKLLVVEVGRPKQVMLQDKIQSVLNRNIKKFIRELHKKQRFYVNDNLKMAMHTSDFSVIQQPKQSAYREIYMQRQVRPIQYYLNCWKFLKLTKPQRKHEIRLSVKVTKVEKISQMA